VLGMLRIWLQETKLSDSSGTLDFMAPEQLGKSTYKGKPADVWSCGCILFMLLSGRLPFEGPSRQIVQTKIRGAMFQFEPVAAWEKVSDSAKDLIRKMVRFTPPPLSTRAGPRDPW
jgi:serine/threonine protein kinase